MLMNKDFMEYVFKRIEHALMESEEYRELQSKHAQVGCKDNEYEDLSCELEVKAQELCYIKGFKDALSLLKL